MTIDHYAVIGNPIGHSKSPHIHNEFAKQCHQDLNYRALLAPLTEFQATVHQFIKEGGRGASVTLPFKLAAFNLCNELTPRARAAGSVNTLSFNDNKILGDNTDGFGLVADIMNNAKLALQQKRILLLGAGGAARGVILPILECNPRELIVANRSHDKAVELADQFKAFGQIKSVKLNEIEGQFDVVINATSASISDQLPSIPDSIYKPGSLAYDLMYADLPTVFMQHAAKQGATTRDGWGMLVEQAAEAFYIWRGVRPDTSSLLVNRNLG